MPAWHVLSSFYKNMNTSSEINLPTAISKQSQE